MVELKAGGAVERILSFYDSRLDQAYREKLKNSQAEKRIFSLDEIPPEVKGERLEQLKRRLGESTGELITQFDGLNSSARYERDVLRLLLSRGTVNPWALYRAYEETHGYACYEGLRNTCNLVRGYISEG